MIDTIWVTAIANLMAPNVPCVHEAAEPGEARRSGFRAHPNLGLSQPARQAARSAALREMALLDAVD